MNFKITSNRSVSPYILLSDILNSGAKKLFKSADIAYCYISFKSDEDRRLAETKQSITADACVMTGQRCMTEKEINSLEKLAKLASFDDADIDITRHNDKIQIHVNYGKSWKE